MIKPLKGSIGLGAQRRCRILGPGIYTRYDIALFIKFYSTKAGKKLIDYNFLQEIGEVGTNMNMQIEQDFAMGNNKI